MTTAVKRCVGAREHRPDYAETDAHHVFPKYLAHLLGVPEIPTTVTLCSGCHDLVHHLIHHLISDGNVDRHHSSPRVMALARRAYGWWAAKVVIA